MTDLVNPAATTYAARHTTAAAGALEEVAAWTQSQTEDPGMMSGLAEARLLEALISVGGATRVLEIGTFTGFGTLTMAAALPPGGRITTLEVDEPTAAAARRHIETSPYAERVELIVGDARETLSQLAGPFDLVYVDAWKVDYPAYYDAVMPKLAERGILVADNLFLGGRVLDEAHQQPGTRGMREFTRRVQADEQVHNVLLTVGDGMMLAWRRPG